MRLEQYQLEADSTFMAFEFISEGPKGRIKKRIEYKIIHSDGIYNLAFGDKNEETGEINDIIITDNKDKQKVLVTVVNSIYQFTNVFPKAWIIIEGSTKVRTRLYRMAITIFFEELNKDFDIYGEDVNNKWYKFEKNQTYTSFLIKRK